MEETSPPPAAISVTLTPNAANVLVDQSVLFMATVYNSTNRAVIWTLSGVGCSGATCGTISSTGLYTAPTPASVIVKATSVADTSKSASATITVLEPDVVEVWAVSWRDSSGKFWLFGGGGVDATGEGGYLNDLWHFIR